MYGKSWSSDWPQSTVENIPLLLSFPLRLLSFLLSTPLSLSIRPPRSFLSSPYCPFLSPLFSTPLSFLSLSTPLFVPSFPLSPLSTPPSSSTLLFLSSTHSPFLFSLCSFISPLLHSSLFVLSPSAFPLFIIFCLLFHVCLFLCPSHSITLPSLSLNLSKFLFLHLPCWNDTSLKSQNDR